MGAYVTGLLGIRNMFAVGSGAAVSLVVAVAAVAFGVALTLCRDRSDRHLEP